MAGKIIIDIERCKGCGLCVEVCPRNCIVISKKSNKSGYFPAEVNNDECTGCAACAIICPDVAIRVLRDANISTVKCSDRKSDKIVKGGQRG